MSLLRLGGLVAVHLILLCSLSLVGQTKVMCLGDSIVQGDTQYETWRYWLWNDLEAGQYNVDFVGTQTAVHGGPVLDPGFDMDHEGYWGWRADMVLAELTNVVVPAWTPGTTPDVVLIHLGTNDLVQGLGVPAVIPETLDEIEMIIGVLRTGNPSVKILLAELIPSTNTILATEIPLYNVELAVRVPTWTMPGSPVVLVDQFTGFDPALDTWDGIHPNTTGEMKMAERWLLSLPDCLGGGLHLVLNQNLGSASAIIRNLGGPAGHEYFTAFTANVANANGGLGSGWFSGLHIPFQEAINEFLAPVPPFRGALDANGRSLWIWYPPSLAPLIGGTVYAISHSIDPVTGLFSDASPPVELTIE